jgi:hypothetical protein
LHVAAKVNAGLSLGGGLPGTLLQPAGRQTSNKPPERASVRFEQLHACEKHGREWVLIKVGRPFAAHSSIQNRRDNAPGRVGGDSARVRAPGPESVLRDIPRLD